VNIGFVKERGEPDKEEVVMSEFKSIPYNIVPDHIISAILSSSTAKSNVKAPFKPKLIFIISCWCFFDITWVRDTNLLAQCCVRTSAVRVTKMFEFELN